MNFALRIFAWLLAAAVTFATLGPPRLGRIPTSGRTPSTRSLLC